MSIHQTAAVEQEVERQYRNPRLPVEDRVADLLSRMTLEEKVAQMLCIWRQKQTILHDDEGKLTMSKLPVHCKHGLGHIARLSDTGGGQNPVEMARLANTLQRFLTRLKKLLQKLMYWSLLDTLFQP